MRAVCHSRLVQRLLSNLINHGGQRRSAARCLFLTCLGLFLTCSSGIVWAVLPAASTGNLYVSMWQSDEVAVFSPDGVSVVRFTTEGLDGPRGIAFNPDNGEIWVAAEFSDAIYIFDSDHRFLRTLSHPEFDEPVGVTFIPAAETQPGDVEVIISNSNGNELMVFDLDGQLLRRYTDDSLNDPNCSAVMPDGSLFVANRLGGTMGTSGSVARFNAAGQFQFDFTAEGIVSAMAVARNPNQTGVDEDDTLWVSSGAGSLGIHEFDLSGNLLRTILPADIDGGSQIVPQGLSVDDSGHLYVVSFTGDVFRFDASGEFLQRFETGSGTPRSSALAICPLNCDGPASFSSSGGRVDIWLLVLLTGLGLYRRSFDESV